MLPKGPVNYILLDKDWRRKFSKKPMKTSAFVAQELLEPSSGRSIDLHYTNGIRVVLPMEAPVEILQDLIAAGG